MKSKENKENKDVDWSQYRLVIEEVAAEDGGGYRGYYPTLGYAILGVADDAQSALEDIMSKRAGFKASMDRLGVTIPPPGVLDKIANFEECPDSLKKLQCYAA